VQPVASGQAFPDPALPGLDGEATSLSADWLGAGCVFVVGHTDCRTTRLILPYAARLRAGAGNGVRVRAILQDDAETALGMLGDLGVDLPTSLDPSPFVLGGLLGLVTVPTTFHVGPDGIVRSVVEGFDRAALERLGRELELSEPLIAPDEDVPALRPG
jgi:hypothetical protein